MKRLLPFLALLPLLALGFVLVKACSEEKRPSRLPEEDIGYYASHVLISSAKHAPGEARILAHQALDLVDRGTPFAEVASTKSEGDSAADGGFLGWVSAVDITDEANQVFHGAIQAMEAGEVRGPILSPAGFHVLKRHGFEEGRRLEAQHRIPAYGFALKYHELDEEEPRTKEETQALATQIVAQLRAGAISMAEARTRHAPRDKGRPDAFQGLAARFGEYRELYAAVAGLSRVGDVAEPFETSQGIALVQRGPFFRSVVRHILVQWSGASNAPLTQRRTQAEALATASEALRAVVPDGSNWQELVTRYTDDQLSAAEKGSIGAVSTGDMDPPLAQAILETRPGSFHGAVVESADGYHILWRVN